MKPVFLVGGTMVSTEGKILDFRFSENSKNELSRNLKHSKYIPRFFSPLALVSSLVHLAHLVHYWFFQKKNKNTDIIAMYKKYYMKTEANETYDR